MARKIAKSERLKDKMPKIETRLERLRDKMSKRGARFGKENQHMGNYMGNKYSFIHPVRLHNLRHHKSESSVCL